MYEEEEEEIGERRKLRELLKKIETQQEKLYKIIIQNSEKATKAMIQKDKR